MSKQTFTFGNISFTIEIDEKPQTNAPRASRVCADEDEERREPDGIVVHVDRPLRENYAYTPSGRVEFDNDMRKYRELERAAKACDWSNRGTIADTKPCCEEHKPTCGCDKKTIGDNVRWIDEPVPVGAKVVGHTWFGEPIYSLD